MIIHYYIGVVLSSLAKNLRLLSSKIYKMVQWSLNFRNCWRGSWVKSVKSHVGFLLDPQFLRKPPWKNHPGESLYNISQLYWVITYSHSSFTHFSSCCFGVYHYDYTQVFFAVTAYQCSMYMVYIYHGLILFTYIWVNW